jgi:hypothetical protein
MWKNCDQVMTVATVVTRNINEATGAMVWGLEESVFGGTLESGGQFCDCVFARKIFSHLI